jgi:hypothetical protein
MNGAVAVVVMVNEKGVEMDDKQIHDMIEALVAEEHRLWDDEAHGGDVEADRARLETIRVTLDRCWDLLRQRRGYEEFGLDADAAKTRDASVVENYRQ